jgi:hypothetical protein
MKRIPVATCVLVCCLFLANAYGQDRPKGAGAAGRKKGAATLATRPDPRPAARAGFAGSVVAVDVGAASFTLKERGNVVGFDAANPVLVGYRTLADMRIGDRVRVSYTATGIEVTKLEGRRAGTQPHQARSAEKPSKRAKKLLKRVRRGSGEDFEDVDMKKDGKITPVELSIVIRDLTMEQFRKYDKKHRGYLDKKEFEDAVRDYHAGGEQ